MDPLAATTSTPALASTIQLAIAPVFLLTAIGAFLAVITTRLGRVVDRARALEASLPDDTNETADQRQATITELSALDRRMLLANRAVALAVASALTVCVLIMVLFVSSVSPIHPDRLVPILFILALILLTAALTAFALEVRISIRTVRVRAELVRNAPRPPGDVQLKNWHFPR